MMKIDPSPAEDKTTRRGFFLGLLGGLAGAAWGRGGGVPAAAGPRTGPVDNVFEPLETRNTGEAQR